MKLAILHANVCADRYDYKKTWSKRRAKFVAQISHHGADLVTLAECQAPAANWLASQAGMKAVSFYGSSILYDPDYVQFTQIIAAKRWLTGSQTHSLIVAEFRVVGSSRTINVGACHFPPFAWRAKLRRQQLATITALAKGWHDKTFIGIDANWTKTFESTARAQGWSSARTSAVATRHADYRTAGPFVRGNPLDYLLTRTRHLPQLLAYDVLDGHLYSDHHSVLVEVDA